MAAKFISSGVLFSFFAFCVAKSLYTATVLRFVDLLLESRNCFNVYLARAQRGSSTRAYTPPPGNRREQVSRRRRASSSHFKCFWLFSNRLKEYTRSLYFVHSSCRLSGSLEWMKVNAREKWKAAAALTRSANTRWKGRVSCVLTPSSFARQFTLARVKVFYVSPGQHTNGEVRLFVFGQRAIGVIEIFQSE